LRPTPRRRHLIEGILDAAANIDTPALLLDVDIVEENLRRLRRVFPGTMLYYAVKANPHSGLLATLAKHGCGMDVASGSEIRLVLGEGTRADRICFTAPFKRPADIAAAHREGVSLFVADSPAEVDAIARHAPGRRLLIRVAVGDGECVNPMGDKFGADPSDVVGLLDRGHAHGLIPWGLHFHVGSQCIDAAKWARAVRLCAPLWREAHATGLQLHVLDIGGGFPVRYLRAVPAIETIAPAILDAVRTHIGPAVEVAVEPGRWLIRDAAVLVSEVMGTARRRGGDWAYLDVGVYNGLIDALDGVRWPMMTLDELAAGRRSQPRPVTLAGPTCDGGDVILRDASLPPLQVGDRVLFFQTGAYTTSFAHFNGLPFPATVELESTKTSAVLGQRRGGTERHTAAGC